MSSNLTAPTIFSEGVRKPIAITPYANLGAEKEPVGSIGIEVGTAPLLWQFRPAPRKIGQLVADLEKAGFVLMPGGKGSRRKFRHSKIPGALILRGQGGDDAKHCQERQVRNAVRDVSK